MTRIRALLVVIAAGLVWTLPAFAQVCSNPMTFTNDPNMPDRAFIVPAFGETVLVTGANILGVADSTAIGMLSVAQVAGAVGNGLGALPYQVAAPTGQVFAMDLQYNNPPLRGAGPNDSVSVTLEQRGGIRAGEKVSITGCSVQLNQA